MNSLLVRSKALACLLLFVPLAPAIAQTVADRQTAQQLYVQARALEQQNRLPQAIASMLQALSLVPKNDGYQAYTAALELKAGQGYFAEARRVLPEAIYLQALALDREDKHDKAAARMEEALRLNPKNTWYRTYLGDLEKLAEGDAFDRHALDTPAEEEKTIERLAKYLVKPAKNDEEKARLIFRWITDRVKYDVETFLTGRLKLSDNLPEVVLEKRLCVCEGYARLYVALARAGGLKAEQVAGRAKTRVSGADGRPVMRVDSKAAGHAWVAVKLDGEWKLLDPTWGSGHVDNGRFVRHYNDYYFLTPPERLIFTHLPKEQRWQFLSTPVAAEEFDRWGEVSSTLFNYGVKTEDVQALVSDKDFKGTVEGFSHTGPRLKLLNVKLHKYLQAGKRYPVE